MSLAVLPSMRKKPRLEWRIASDTARLAALVASRPWTSTPIPISVTQRTRVIGSCLWFDVFTAGYCACGECQPSGTSKCSLVRVIIRCRPAIRRQQEFCVVDDIARIAIVADEADAAILPFEPHEVAGGGACARLEHGDHFPALDPGRLKPHTPECGVDREEPADLGRSEPYRISRLMQLHIIGQQRPQAIPVLRVEHRNISRDGLGNRPR